MEPTTQSDCRIETTCLLYTRLSGLLLSQKNFLEYCTASEFCGVLFLSAYYICGSPG